MLAWAGGVLAEPVNVAGTGTASQSSEWNGGQFPAALAIDGDPATFSHTDVNSLDNGWQLVLPEPWAIERVELVTRGDCCGGRLTNATLRIFDGEGDSVFEARVVDPGPGSTLGFPVPPGTEALRIRIGFESGAVNPDGNRIVHLGEVRVMADIDLLPTIRTFEVVPPQAAPGEEIELRWEVEGAGTVSISGIGEVSSAGSLRLRPASTAEWILSAVNDHGERAGWAGCVIGGVVLDPVLTEFMADNRSVVLAEGGETSDWIEVHNPNAVPIDLGGHHLTDDPADPFKWAFPIGTTLAEGASLVVEAGSGRSGAQHWTGFALAREGGSYVALTAPDGRVLTAITYPSQKPDVSYGVDPEGAERYFTRPSPGVLNGVAGVRGFVADTRFSVDRGFYDAPFALEIRCATEGADVLFTVDGSVPGPDNPSALRFGQPIEIAGTTVVRAAAFLDGFEPSNVDTQTYLFPGDIASQSAAVPDGYPDRWVPANAAGVAAPIPAPSDYGVDPRVAAAGPFTGLDGEAFDFRAALASIPSMSLVLPAGDLLDPVRGIHANAQLRGRLWERLASIEFLDPATGDHVQAECGVRTHGGWNRFPEMLKKSLRLYFRQEYGDAKFRAPLFPDAGIDTFDRLLLRSGNGKAWASPWRALSGGGNSLPRVLYLRDQFMRDSQRDMGQPHVAGTFVHLYVNGLYWGLYNPVERPDEHYASSRFGGEDEDYDVLKWIRGSGHAVAAGDDVAWNELVRLARAGVAGPGEYAAVSRLLDLENFADYMLVNFWGGNIDWVDSNTYAIRNRAVDGPYRFFCWDSEETFLEPARDSTEAYVSDTSTELHRALRANTEYRMLFADRAQKHLFNGGALSPESAEVRFMARVGEIDRAIVGESARWGDLMRPSQPYTRERDWLGEVNNIRSNYLPRRPGVLLQQLRADGLYPAVEAPRFAPQRGGVVESGFRLLLEAPGGEGTIYYTLDGSDPRLPGGAVSPSAIAFNGELLPRTLVRSGVGSAVGGVWRFLDSGADLGASDIASGDPRYGPANWKHPDFDDTGWLSGPSPLGFGSISGTVLRTTLPSGDALANRPVTAYFRHAFDVPADLAFARLRLGLLRDDGAIAYLNGVEVARSNLPQGVVVSGTTPASATANADEGEYFAFDVPPGLLRAGRNVLAAEVHQITAASSDLGFDLALDGDVVEGGSGSIGIIEDTLVRARARLGSEWSALDEAVYFAGDRSADLVVSEIMYHPGEAASAGAEFVEIVNRGSVSRRIADLRLAEGVRFAFSSAGVAILEPGQRVLVVRDRAAFSAAHPSVPEELVIGEFDGALDDSGDRIVLEDALGGVLATIEFDDAAPWPGGTDGEGRSLTFIQGDPSDPANWRPSVEVGGSPGRDDRMVFGGGDVLGHAFPGGDPAAVARRGEDGRFRLEHFLRPGADEVAVSAEWSRDLAAWSVDAVSRAAIDPVGDGDRLRVRWVLDIPAGREGPVFFRLRVEAR